MSALGIFKTRKSASGEKNKENIKTPKVSVSKAKLVDKKPAPTRLDENKFGWRIIKSPHITEKAAYLESKNQYAFKVFDRANKNEIKKAVEEIYKVNVTDVNIIKVRRKLRKKGKIVGYKTGYKKALVSLKAGQKIEILPR